MKTYLFLYKVILVCSFFTFSYTGEGQIIVNDSIVVNDTVSLTDEYVEKLKILTQGYNKRILHYDSLINVLQDRLKETKNWQKKKKKTIEKNLLKKERVQYIIFKEYNYSFDILINEYKKKYRDIGGCFPQELDSILDPQIDRFVKERIAPGSID